MRRRGKLVPIAALALVVTLGCLLYRALSDSPGQGRLRLPVGHGQPAISLGERHGLILASDGSLWVWGSEFVGWPVLGLGTSSVHSVNLRRVGQETNWLSISAGASHSVALKADGTLWTWGESVESRSTPLKALYTPVPAAPGHDWKQAAAGGIHTLAIKEDGTLWGWGDNWAGVVGIPSPNGSAVPVQIGTARNWIRVWATTLESVGQQADGTLWYWGENPDKTLADAGKNIFAPTRVNLDTNWVDVGFAERTVLAIKSDGTLWAWGQYAQVFTGATNTVQNTAPTRVGTDADWRSISAAPGWWCAGLSKHDGSLWLLDASDGKPNGPRPPYKPARFRRLEFGPEAAAYAGGAMHAAPAGVHGPIGVVLTPEGEVWTWGLVLGDPPSWKSQLQGLGVSVLNTLGVKVPRPEAAPLFRQRPWRLRNLNSATAAGP